LGAGFRGALDRWAQKAERARKIGSATRGPLSSKPCKTREKKKKKRGAECFRARSDAGFHPENGQSRKKTRVAVAVNRDSQEEERKKKKKDPRGTKRSLVGRDVLVQALEAASHFSVELS